MTTEQRMPQPGELWRVAIRPVEWHCPHCHAPLEIGGTANNGLIARIIPPVQDWFLHVHPGCDQVVPFPRGWVWYTTRELNGNPVLYTLPWTLFEPLTTGRRTARLLGSRPHRTLRAAIAKAHGK